MTRHGSVGRMFAFWLLPVLAICWGCSSRVPGPVAADRQAEVQRVVMAPFQNMERIYGANASFTCPLCGNTYFIGQVAEGGEEFMTEQLFEHLRRRSQIETLPPEQVEGARASVLRSSSSSELSELQLLLESGRALKAEAVIFGRVYRFGERQGTAFATDKPASVAFDVLMVSTDDGRLLWEGHFNETQRPLSDNLLNLDAFIQQKGRWLTARELAVIGLDKVMQRFWLP